MLANFTLIALKVINATNNTTNLITSYSASISIKRYHTNINI